MRFKKYYKDILSLIASLSLLASVYFANHYDIKQLYREFVGLRLKVQVQEKLIDSLEDRVNLLSEQNEVLLVDLEEHNETRGIENAVLLERLQNLEYKIEVLGMKSTLSNISGNDRFEFTDKQVNRVGQYETKGQVLVAWKDDYLTTAQFKLNTIGQLTLEPKIHKVDKKHFYPYLEERSIGGITISGQGPVQEIPPPKNQISIGPFIGIAYNTTTGLTEPIVGIGMSYNLFKLWDWK